MQAKLYMVIETFRPGCREAVYARFEEKGRMLPEGLRYINSWVEPEGDRCFQLMKTGEPSLFTEWTSCWEDLVEFEVLEVESMSGGKQS